MLLTLEPRTSGDSVAHHSQMSYRQNSGLLAQHGRTAPRFGNAAASTRRVDHGLERPSVPLGDGIAIIVTGLVLGDNSTPDNTKELFEPVSAMRSVLGHNTAHDTTKSVQ